MAKYLLNFSLATFLILLLGGCVQKRAVKDVEDTASLPDCPPEEVNKTQTTQHNEAAIAQESTSATSAIDEAKIEPEPVTASASTPPTMSNEEFDSAVELANALYVQVFVTKSKDTARKVLSNIKSKYPEKASVIKTAGMYKVIVGPYKKEDVDLAKDNIQKIKDYESAFIINHFNVFQK